MYRAFQILAAACLAVLISSSPYSSDPSLFFRSYESPRMLDRLRCPDLEHPSWGSGGGGMGVRRILFSTPAVVRKEHTWRFCSAPWPDDGLVRTVERNIINQIESAGCTLEARLRGAKEIGYRCGDAATGFVRVDITEPPASRGSDERFRDVRIRIEERNL
jgi:hypothetical protein